MDHLHYRRGPFLLCLGFLAGATALLAVGTNIRLWIAGRLLQGVSSGMLWVVCLALLTDTVGPDGIGKAVGIIGIPLSVGPIVGPLIGGVIYARGGYFAVFGLIFGMLGVDAVLRLVMIEKKSAGRGLEGEAPRSDLPGTSCKSNSSMSTNSFPEILNTTCSTAGTPNEPTKEVSFQRPIGIHRLPSTLRLLLSFRMIVSLIGGLLQSSLNVAFDSTLPLMVNTLFNWNQTGQGLIFITILLPSLLQPLFGAMTDRHRQGRRLLAAGGCLLATPGYVLLRLVTHDTFCQKALLCFLLMIIGLGMAVAMPAIIAEIGAIVADFEKNDPQAVKRSVVATGWSLVNAAYAAGCLIGPLFAGFIYDAAGWQTMTWCLGILSGVTGVFLLLCLGGWVGKLEMKSFIPRASR